MYCVFLFISDENFHLSDLGIVIGNYTDNLNPSLALWNFMKHCIFICVVGC